MIISVCGPLGYEKARQLYAENEKMLKERFASFFIRQFEELEKECIPSGFSDRYSSEGKFAAAENNPVVRFCMEIGERGLYGALWEAGEALGCGMKIAAEAIPVRQEIVEILELFDESPYECLSGGSFLVITEREEERLLFDGEDIPLSMIGITTGTRERVLESKTQIRYLTPSDRQDKDIEDRKKGHNFS